MGQAKRRGNFEQRKAQGIKRIAAEEEAALERHREAQRERYRRESERQATMTDEEREAERNRRKRGRRALTMAGMMGAMVTRDIVETYGDDIPGIDVMEDNSYDPIVIDGDHYRNRRR